MKTIYGSCSQEDSGLLRKRLEDRKLKNMHGKQTKKRWKLTWKVA